MLNIVRKRIKNSEASVEEFQNANRNDLKSREVAQIAVLKSYITESGSMGEEDITSAIQDVIGRMRSEEKTVNQGSVMKSLVGPGGTLENQAVDRQVVAKLVKGGSCLIFCPQLRDCGGGIQSFPFFTTQIYLKRETLTSKSFRNVMIAISESQRQASI